MSISGVNYNSAMDRRKSRVAWTPQPGSQVNFLQCPIYEVLYHGNRGPGKTDALLMDFVQEVGKGWGPDWRGVLFRKTFPELSDVINKSMKWFSQIFPKAVYNKANYTWTFPGGEELLFRHMKVESDYYAFHGHAYPWIGWEELTTWNTDKCFKVMMSCSRSTRVGMPRKVRATTNPYGPGSNWVKRRYQLPQMDGRIVRTPGEPDRVAIKGYLSENRLLLNADPGYPDRIRAAARNPAELAAWVDGSWDINAGGMFDDVWEDRIHVLPRIPWKVIPRSWKLDRSFDWGSSKPFSVGWWAESSGEPIVIEGRKIGGVRGDLIQIDEWYGFNGERNCGVRMLASEVAQGIKDREQDWGIWKLAKAGPADTSIWDEENGMSIVRDFTKKGVIWTKADKGPGSRTQGWEQMRKMMRQALPNKDGTPRELPGFFTTLNCANFNELVTAMSRDEKVPDDIDTDLEDHCFDMARYRVRRKEVKAAQRPM